MPDEWKLRFTFETTVPATNKEIAEQAARKKARAMNRDAANSSVSLVSTEVEKA